MGTIGRLALPIGLAVLLLGCSSNGGGVIKPEPSSKSPMQQQAEKGGTLPGK